MKKTTLLLSFIIFFTICTDANQYPVKKKPIKQDQPKVIRYYLSENDAVVIHNLLQVTKVLLPQSTLPANQAVAYIQQCDSIQKMIALQYKKNNPDTTINKK